MREIIQNKGHKIGLEYNSRIHAYKSYYLLGCLYEKTNCVINFNFIQRTEGFALHCGSEIRSTLSIYHDSNQVLYTLIYNHSYNGFYHYYKL